MCVIIGESLAYCNVLYCCMDIVVEMFAAVVVISVAMFVISGYVC